MAFELLGHSDTNIAVRLSVLRLENRDQRLLRRVELAPRWRLHDLPVSDFLIRQHQQIAHCHEIAPRRIIVARSHQDQRAQQRLR